MAQISNNRTQIINKLMRRFNLSQQQLIAVAAVVVLAIVSAVVLIGIISAGTSESFDRSHNKKIMLQISQELIIRLKKLLLK